MKKNTGNYTVPELAEGWLIDTPGIKGFGTFDMAPEELTSYFPEIFPSRKTAVSPTAPTPTNPAVPSSRPSKTTTSPKAAISPTSP